MIIYMFTPVPGKMIQFDEQISDHRVRHAKLSSERTGFRTGYFYMTLDGVTCSRIDILHLGEALHVYWKK